MVSLTDSNAQGIAVVTGASRGLGAAIAAELASRGISVLGVARGSFNAPYPTLAADLTRSEGVDAVLKTVGGRSLQILVHTAGILGPRTEIATYPLADWENVIATNLTAVFRLTQALLPAMRRPGGAILTVASGAGRRAAPRWGAYAVSKFGIDGFSLLLAAELEPEGIRVHSINPGGMRTRMRAEAYPDENPESVPPPEAIAPFFAEVALAAVGKFPVLVDAPR